jgi:hypothetical protein
MPKLSQVEVQRVIHADLGDGRNCNDMRCDIDHRCRACNPVIIFRFLLRGNLCSFWHFLDHKTIISDSALGDQI